MTIPGPTLPIGHEDRGIDCEFAAEPEFQALADRIVAVGWTAEEAAAALVSLAAAHVAARRENALTEAAVSKARRKVSQ